MVSTRRTSRLLLRPYTPADAPALYAFMSNHTAMRHTYIAPNLAHCSARLASYEEMRARLGFAPWVVQRNGDENLTGWGGLSVDPDEPEWGLEVSYALAPHAWGFGYATELVSASLAAAFSELSAPEVSAFARPENTASIRVLEKCGFQRVRFEPRLERLHFRARSSGAA